MPKSFPLVIYAYTDRFTLSLYKMASKEVIPSFEIAFTSSYHELATTVMNSSTRPALILLDVDRENSEELEELAKENIHEDIPFIFLSSRENEDVLLWAKEFRALSVLSSPGNLESMKLVIDVVNIFMM